MVTSGLPTPHVTKYRGITRSSHSMTPRHSCAQLGLPLHIAARRGSPNILYALLAGRGASKHIDLKDRSGDTPLHLACRLNNKEGVQTLLHLLDAGADPSLPGARHSGLSPYNEWRPVDPIVVRPAADRNGLLPPSYVQALVKRKQKSGQALSSEPFDEVWQEIQMLLDHHKHKGKAKGGKGGKGKKGGKGGKKKKK